MKSSRPPSCCIRNPLSCRTLPPSDIMSASDTGSYGMHVGFFSLYAPCSSCRRCLSSSFFFVSLLVCVYGFGRTRRSSDTKRHWLTFLQKRNVDGNGCFGGGMEGNRNKNPSVRERGGKCQMAGAISPSAFIDDFTVC